MAALAFKPATIVGTKARVCFAGPPGSGKTLTSLRTARALVGPSGRIALIDTESRSASKYAPYESFDVLELDSFDPKNYIDAIHLAERAGYDVIIIDSLSHAWAGKDGLLEQHAAAERKTKNSYTAWKDITPLHNELVESIIRSTAHIITTMRVKEAHEISRDNDGKVQILKLGLQPIQREGIRYEFDVLIDIDTDHVATVDKSRFPAIDGQVYRRPVGEIGDALRNALSGLEQSDSFRGTYEAASAPVGTPLIEDTTPPVTRDTEANSDLTANASTPAAEGPSWRERISKEAGKGIRAVANLLPEIQTVTPVSRRNNIMPYYWQAIADTALEAIEFAGNLDDLADLKPILADLPTSVKIKDDTISLDRAGIFAAAQARSKELKEDSL